MTRHTTTCPLIVNLDILFSKKRQESLLSLLVKLFRQFKLKTILVQYKLDLKIHQYLGGNINKTKGHLVSQPRLF